MIKLENVDVYGWETVIRGMRNPLNSWDKSDSGYADPACEDCPCLGVPDDDFGFGACKNSTGHCYTTYEVGPNDLKLMRNLAKAGNDHGKFARMINVTADITAPLYWWKEFDTYKVGTVANSCSTMHKIHAKEFTLEDFSCEHLIGNLGEDSIDKTEMYVDNEYWTSVAVLTHIIRVLNFYRNKFLETKDKKYWWQMIQLLPSSYNQKRTVQLNYQVLWAMYQARKNHKLDEWRDFCAWCESLPYFKEIYIDG